MRFVSTPEVLKRFVSVEREIVQIENELASAAVGDEDGTLAANLCSLMDSYAITFQHKLLCKLLHCLSDSVYYNSYLTGNEAGNFRKTISSSKVNHYYKRNCSLIFP